MRHIFSITLLFFFFCPTAQGAELPLSETEAVAELLLYYDWDELLVETSTRRPSKLKYVAENMAVITAEEIEAMNAYSINEVLQTVAGVNFPIHGNFGGTGTIKIQGSNFEYTVILLDGIRLNTPDSGYPATEGIPVQIVDRIEIVKGPATSAWGSAVGGVINIITKKAEKELQTAGTLYASYATKGNSQDYRLEVKGKAKKLHYYLYGGFQDSAGLLEGKSYENKSFYAKIGSESSTDTSWILTAGSLKPETNYFIEPTYDVESWFKRDYHFITGRLNTKLSQNVKLDLDLHYAQLDNSSPHYVHGSGLYGDAGDLLWDYIADIDIYGGNAKVIWEKGPHSVLAGVEYEQAEVGRQVQYGPYWQAFGSPAKINAAVGQEKRTALFVNDTFKWAKLSITPGLRYDHISISDKVTYDYLNPSMGLTYNLTDKTLFRATAANGFRHPGISQVDPTPLWGSNPDLKPEDIWSFQAGLESGEFKKVHLKTDLFYHRILNSWQDDSALDCKVNGGEENRKGIEVSATSSPFENFTGSLSFSYTHIAPYEDESGNLISLIAKFNYHTQRLGNILLLGRYVSWGDVVSPDWRNGKYDHIIWDLHYNIDIPMSKSTNINLFLSTRNLFSGSQYWDESYKNPGRWLQAGLRLHF